MIKKIICTVVFPQTFEWGYDTEAAPADVIAAVKNHAGYLMETSQSEPYIVAVSGPDFATVEACKQAAREGRGSTIDGDFYNAIDN